MKKIAALCLTLSFALNANAQKSSDGFWELIKEKEVNVTGKRQIIPQKYLTLAKPVD